MADPRRIPEERLVGSTDGRTSGFWHSLNNRKYFRRPLAVQIASISPRADITKASRLVTSLTTDFKSDAQTRRVPLNSKTANPGLQRTWGGILMVSGGK